MLAQGHPRLLPSGLLRRQGLVAAGLAVLLLIVAAFGYVWSQREDPANRPYLQILGGGFVFNYRVNDVYYGFTARVVRPLPVGTILEAVFDDPSGAERITVRERLGRMTTRYSVRTPALSGVRADRTYHVDIRLFDRNGTEMIWETQREYRSNIDQAVMPDGPLTTGPGYAPAPAGERLLKRQ